MLYIFIAVCIFILGIYLLGRFNHKFNFYRDDEGRIGGILLIGAASLFWPISIALAILAGSVYLVIIGALKVISIGEKK